MQLTCALYIEHVNKHHQFDDNNSHIQKVKKYEFSPQKPHQQISLRIISCRWRNLVHLLIQKCLSPLSKAACSSSVSVVFLQAKVVMVPLVKTPSELHSSQL